MITFFMAGVTHEFKTPLSVIKLHSKNLLTYHTRLPEQKRTELLNSTQTQVNLLQKLIENILELSRLGAGTASHFGCRGRHHYFGGGTHSSVASA